MKTATPIARQDVSTYLEIQNLLLFKEAQAFVLNALIRRNTNFKHPLIGLSTVSTFVDYLRCKLMGGMSSSMLGMPLTIYDWNRSIKS